MDSTLGNSNALDDTLSPVSRQAFLISDCLVIYFIMQAI